MTTTIITGTDIGAERRPARPADPQLPMFIPRKVQ